jgi:hypothetical protein
MLDHEGRAEDVEHHKQDLLKKQKEGKGHWKDELASNSESIVCLSFSLHLTLLFVEGRIESVESWMGMVEVGRMIAGSGRLKAMLTYIFTDQGGPGRSRGFRRDDQETAGGDEECGGQEIGLAVLDL